jgi:HEPN domain-containing protein
MAPKLRDSGDPDEWLRHARSNLSRCRADRSLPDVLFEDLCFDAQQAAEKALKAVLVLGGRRFPKTHDLAELLHLVAATGLRLPPEVLEAKRLTPYAVAGVIRVSARMRACRTTRRPSRRQRQSLPGRRVSSASRPAERSDG